MERQDSATVASSSFDSTHPNGAFSIEPDVTTGATATSDAEGMFHYRSTIQTFKQVFGSKKGLTNYFKSKFRSFEKYIRKTVNKQIFKVKVC